MNHCQPKINVIKSELNVDVERTIIVEILNSHGYK